MTPLSTLPPAPTQEQQSRRAVGRALAGGLAALAVAPALVGGEAEAAEAKKAPRKWHRCKVHKKHTCWHATTCKHRKHKPQKGGGGKDPKGPDDPGTPPPPPVPGSYDGPAVVDGLPTTLALHVGSRLTYGVTPALVAEMAAYPSLQAWIDAQLQPDGLPDGAGDALWGWWPALSWDAPRMWAEEQAQNGAAWEAMADYQRWCLLRRIVSRRQLFEAVVELFEDHLHVPVHDDGVFGFRVDYGRTIRQHALGRFDEMLVATTTHPAMGISLDNATSTKKAPNENLGRELLELHTVGRGHYTEDDVKASARILTGYRVATWTTTWRVYYDPASHWTGPVTVMGFSDPNAASDGRPVTEAYLRYLAHHRGTAERLARKLAIRFVSDDPSPGLVQHLADVYQQADTAIVPVLRALLASAEFQQAAGQKVRTPADDVVATWRALAVQPSAPGTDDAAANAILWQTVALGQAPYDWARPDGQPQDGAAWSSVSRVLASFESHYSMCGGWWPKGGLAYRPLASWVPLTGTDTMRFDALVEHLSRQLLSRSASARLQEACSLATGLSASTKISLSHALVKWNMPTLLTTVLDNPEHMTR
jgi:hypothetical protein